VIAPGAVMDGLGARLATIAGLRVFDYLADAIAPPAAVVAVEEIFYDQTMMRGSDSGRFLIHVMVGRASERAARDALDPYLAGFGERSVKRAVEDGGTLIGAWDSVRVESATVSVMTVGAVDYLTATYVVDVIA
jgi:hypothetical protein